MYTLLENSAGVWGFKFNHTVSVFPHLPPESLSLIRWDNFVLYSFAKPVLCTSTCLFTTPQEQLLLFRYLMCLLYFLRWYISYLFRQKKVTRCSSVMGSSQFQTMLLPRKATTFAPHSTCIGVSNFRSAQCLRSACFSKLKVKHAEGEGKLNLFCQKPVKQL